jgi:uncharacterized protein YdhG (YjbR/CyaY superfamily)
MNTEIQSVDEYMEKVALNEARPVLQKIREIIHSEVPGVVEGISYGMASFKRNKDRVYFAAFAKHCSFFPGAIVQDFLPQLKDYKTSKGTIQFTVDKPLPEKLVRAILRARFRSGS